MLRFRAAVLFLLMLLPSFWMAWRNQDMPHFAYMHDDSVYYVTAKSLAEGTGLIIPSLPSQAAETKFPPGLPVYQALSWMIEPRFPENLRVALWMQWIWFPLFLWLALRCWRAWGFDEWTGWALAAAAAINVFVFFGSVSVLTELPFLCLLLGSLLLARRAESDQDRETGWAVLAGAMAAGAFLFRTVGIFLLAGFPLLMLWRRRFAPAIAYATPVVFAFTGWTLFVQANKTAGPPGEIYYTSYLGYHLGGFQFDDIPALIWRNLDGVTLAMGTILLPAQGDFPFLAIVVRAIGIMAIIGAVRLVRRGQALDYALFSVTYLLSLLVWHQPNERIILPVFPLLLAGLGTEFTHVGLAIRRGFSHPKRDQRIASWLLAGAGVFLIGWIGLSHWQRMHVDMQGLMESERAHLKAEQPAFAWVRAKLPKDATVLTGQDPLFYLFTGRRAVRPLVPLRHWYRDDTAAGVFKIYDELDEYARANRLQYVYWGLRTPLPSGDMMERVTSSVQRNRGLEELYRHSEGTMFRVRKAASAHRTVASPAGN